MTEKATYKITRSDGTYYFVAFGYNTIDNPHFVLDWQTAARHNEKYHGVYGARYTVFSWGPDATFAQYFPDLGTFYTQTPTPSQKKAFRDQFLDFEKGWGKDWKVEKVR